MYSFHVYCFWVNLLLCCDTWREVQINKEQLLSRHGCQQWYRAHTAICLFGGCWVDYPSSGKRNKDLKEKRGSVMCQENLYQLQLLFPCNLKGPLTLNKAWRERAKLQLKRKADRVRGTNRKLENRWQTEKAEKSATWKTKYVALVKLNINPLTLVCKSFLCPRPGRSSCQLLTHWVACKEDVECVFAAQL